MAYPIEKYIEQADDLAQKVVNVWGACTSAGDQGALTPEFMALFDRAYRYQQAKRIADSYREFTRLSAKEESEERETRLAFAESYKALDDSIERKAAGAQ